MSDADLQALAQHVAQEMSEPLLYSVAAAAKVLDLSEPSVRRLVKEEKLRPFTGHGLDRTQFSRRELERFVAGDPLGAEPADPGGSFGLVGVKGGELTYDGEDMTAKVADHLETVFRKLDERDGDDG